MASVVVVILNWNGGADTVACLISLQHQTFRDFRTVVVDNGSEDDSVAQIEGWADANDSDLVLVEAGENLGFAAGSNLGIRRALKLGAEFVLLLNNDATLEPDALRVMAGFLVSRPDYAAATGLIRYADRPVVWNCGGDLTWFGSRKYLFGERPLSEVPRRGWRQITFITGCAALVRASVFIELGLFTERFFFGEEDYEFSLRLRHAQRHIASCFDAVIKHRVGSSIDRTAPPGALGRYYIYYLNRFIDMRDEYPRPFWWAWRYMSLAVAMPRLKRSRGLSWGSISMLARRLLRDSSRLDGVTRERFEAANRFGLESLP